MRTADGGRLDAVTHRAPGGLVAAAVIVVVSTAVLTSVARAAAPRPVSRCAGSAVRFALQVNAGMGHGSDVVVVRNEGVVRCTLTGYPTVRVALADHRDRSFPAYLQRVTRPGATAAVRDLVSSYAGGYVGPVAASTAKALPVVVLAPGAGVASFTLVWIDMATSERPCPISSSIEFGLPGSIDYRPVGRASFVCSVVGVTPFVRGPSGEWR